MIQEKNKHFKKKQAWLAIYNVGKVWLYDNQIWAINPVYKFYENIARKIGGISMVVPVKNELPPRGSFLIDTNLLEIVNLDWYSSLKDAWSVYMKNGGGIKPLNISRWDVLVLMDPMYPHFWHLISQSKKKKIRTVIYLRANEARNISCENFNFRSVILKLISSVVFWRLRKVFLTTPLLVAGSELYMKFRDRASSVKLISPSIIELDSFNQTLGTEKKREGDESHTILYVGRLAKEKGIEILLKAIANLELNERVRLNIVGADNQEGLYQRKLQELAKALGIEKIITFLGRIPYGDRLFEEYARADIFVLPSFSEGRPKVLYEAMAGGCGIVATNVGGVKDVIKDGYNGFLISAGAQNELCKSIESLLNDSSLLNSIQKNALSEAKNYTMETTTDKFIEAIYGILDEKKNKYGHKDRRSDDCSS